MKGGGIGSNRSVLRIDNRRQVMRYEGGGIGSNRSVWIDNRRQVMRYEGGGDRQ